MFEPMARHSGEVVLEAGRAGFIVDETSRVQLGSTSGIDRTFDLEDDARIAGPVRQEVGERVQMVMRRGSHRDQEREEIEGRRLAQGAPSV